METFLHSVTHPLFVCLSAGFLVALALVTGVRWCGCTSNAIRALKAGSAALSGIPDQRMFASNFHESTERIMEALISEPALASAWDSWSEGFQQVERSDGASVISCERPPGDCINLKNWERRLAMHWYRALPNYLVGLGLCFTFLGIVAVIFLAAAALRTGTDVADQTNALRDLLDAAAFKFITSLVGVLLSIVYSFYFRWRQTHVERAIVTLQAGLSRRVLILNATTLLREIREEGRRQTGCLESMATTVGVAIGKELADAARIMGKAIAQLEGAVKAMDERMGSKLDGLSDGIVNTTSKDLGKLVSAAVDTLTSTLNVSLSDIVGTLQKTAVEIESTREAFREVAANTDKVSKTYASLPGEIRAWASEVQAMLLRTATELETSFTGSVESAGKIHSAIYAVAERLDPISDGLANAAGCIEDAAAEWLDMKEDLSRFSRVNETASATVAEAVNALNGQWMTQGERIGQIDMHLAATIAAVQQHFDGYSQRLREYTKEMDAQLGRAVGQFSATIADFGDAPERFADAGEQLQKAAQNAVDALEPLWKLDGLAAAISKSADALLAAIPTTPLEIE